MSNTDGEDTQRNSKPINLHYWGSEENFANHLRCDDELDPIYRHDYVVELAKELASLREQLKQQEEVIRELTEVLSHYFDLGYIHGMGYTGKHRIESLLEKAKSLTTKDK